MHLPAATYFVCVPIRDGR